MRNTLPILLLATLAACTADDMDAPAATTDGATPIAFAGARTAETDVTRAATTPLEQEGVTSFRVWGAKNMSYAAATGYADVQTVMQAYTVTWHDGGAATTSASHDWDYVNGTTQTIKYWDMSAAAYRFFATAPATAGATAATTADATSITLDVDATDAATVPLYSRLWVSNGSPADYPDRPFGQAVRLEFVRPVARVRFMFVQSDPAATVALADKRFAPTDAAGIALRGTIAITYPLTGTATAETWQTTPSAASADRLAAFTTDYYETPADAGARTWYSVLPADARPFTLAVAIDGETRTIVVPAQYMAWQPGYAYTYVFKVSGEGGGSVELDNVAAAFTPWQEVATESHEIYNW
ncbi:MAG: hypothetical protein IJS59_05615 [Bacteroidaceae bacterium]|nr:hypothetical protein [Bacteroidaceae bacterium]